jgi:hypothetical protein
MEIQKLIEVWSLSSDIHSFHSPAIESDLKSLEKKIGHRLPSSFREFYLFSNGANLLSDNLRVYPLEGTDESLGLSNASAQLRAGNYPIPDEILVFGSNGSDDLFGIWLPETKNEFFRCPVLQIGEIFEPKCMAIAGTDFVPFLYSWTAYYLMLYETNNAAIDALGIPYSLRHKADEMDDDIFAQLCRWADPRLRDSNPNPYEHGYDAEELKILFRG